MLLKYILLFTTLFFTACTDNKPTIELDGKKLLEQKCASCHDLNMPPVLSLDELAPPMMSVSIHIYDFVKPKDEAQRAYEAVEFVVDYVKEPSSEKSFCDKDSLEKYGLMPSQKDGVTDEETKAIAKYMFNNYTQKRLAEAMEAKMKYDALPDGEKIALKNSCLGCHRVNKDLVGPSFIKIQKKFASSQDTLKESIKNGSKGEWESSRAVMPAFGQLTNEELDTLAKWILTLR
ncbi:MAG: c-type cytochrome [Sulfurimonas sp.]|jgi:cytochrome c